jgi:hypothetical protein
MRHLAKLPVQEVSQFRHRGKASQLAIVGHADGAALFANGDGEGIGLLADSNGGTVPHVQVAIQTGIFRQGQPAGRRHDGVAAQDYGSVVQGIFTVKNGA